MKRSNLCPKCNGKELLHARQFAVVGWKQGSVEAFACGTCGYTELYAPFEMLREGGFKPLTASGSGGAYR